MNTDPQIYKFKLSRAPIILRHFFSGASVVVISTNIENEKAYYTPKSLKGDLFTSYQNKLDWIIKYHKTLYKRTDSKAYAMQLLPLAYLVDMQIAANRQQIVNAVRKLKHLEDSYFSALADSLAQTIGLDLDTVENYDSLFEQNIPIDRDAVKLIDYIPKNEMAVIEDITYQDTWLNRQELGEQIDELNYREKYEILRKIDSAQINATYNFELIVEPQFIAIITQYIEQASVQQQAALPFYGYEIAEEDDNDTATEMYEKCFDMSFELFSELQAKANPEIAQLACLFGHKQRYYLQLSYDQLLKLADAQNRTLFEEILQAASVVHPTLFESVDDIDI